MHHATRIDRVQQDVEGGEVISIDPGAPGRDWFYVLEGTARLVFGEREHLVEAGQAAEFNTMTPHWFVGYGGPVDMVVIFDRHGEGATSIPANEYRILMS